MTRLSPHRHCEQTGEPELFCEHCDDLLGVRETTPWSKAGREPKPAHGWLTPRREQALRDTLRDLPDRLALVHRVIGGENLGEPTRGVPGLRPPLSIAALDLSRHRGRAVNDPIAHMAGRSSGVLDMLASWVRLAEAEMCDEGIECTTPAATPTVSSESAWLLRHIVWILDQQWVTELADDIAKVAADIRAALHERPEYRPRCTACKGHVEQATGGLFVCTSCHREYFARELVSLQQPMTADQLTRAFEVTAEAIRQWKARGLLEPATDHDGQPIKSGKAWRYHVTDVLRLIDSGQPGGKRA